MSGTDRVAKKRERRVIQRSREREEMFISDYVKHKYPDIHTEAVQVYQLLATKYPNKTDVRKTIEHKAWKITNATILHPAFDTQQPSTIPTPCTVEISFSATKYRTLNNPRISSKHRTLNSPRTTIKHRTPNKPPNTHQTQNLQQTPNIHQTQNLQQSQPQNHKQVQNPQPLQSQRTQIICGWLFLC